MGDMKESLFLVGGGGFIGKNLVRRLHDKYNITVFDKFIDTPFFAQYPDVETFAIDLVEDLIPRYDTFRPNYIINLAAIVTAERDMSLFDKMIQVNLKVLLNLFARFKDDRNLKLLVQFGSSEEYGSEFAPFYESQREIPTSPYALVKQLTVNTAIMLYRNYGFPTMAVRPGNIFGPMQPKNKFIPYVLENLKAGYPIDVTPCEQKRDTLHVDDFIWMLDQLLKHYEDCRGEIINLSSGESIMLKDIIELGRAYLNSSSEVHYGKLPYRANEVMDLRCSVEKFEEITGKKVQFNIKERLKQYIDTL